jgi:hypothetical protein
MNLVLGICAAVAAAVGAGLLWWRARVGKEIALMAAVETSGAGSVAALAPGTLVEVKGTLRVRVPLAGEYSGQPCAYYKCEIEREETYYERNSDGRDERRTRTTTVYSNTKYGQCLVEDVTGKVGLDFEGADVEAVKVIDEPTAPPGGSGGVIGGVLSALSNTNSSYRRREFALAPDIAVYVLGEVHEGGLIGKPLAGSKSKTFIVSHKSEEERTKSLSSTRRWILVGAIVLFVLAAVLAYFGVKVGPDKKAASTETVLILRSA